MCRIANVFKIPVVMSGQTIGNWRSAFNRYVARSGFKHVRYITLRDETESLKDLQEIGLSGANIFPTHDDALHCEKDESFETGCVKGKYIAVNFHSWGMDEKAQSAVLIKIRKIICEIRNLMPEYRLIFIPMIPTDVDSYSLYKAAYPEEKLELFRYDYDFRKVRKVIADSYCCVTMKHHPIIFAAGEGVPVISLNFSEYYEHKNRGALSQYNLAEFSVSLSDKSFLEKFTASLATVKSSRELITARIRESISKLDARRNKFLEMIKPLAD